MNEKPIIKVTIKNFFVLLLDILIDHEINIGSTDAKNQLERFATIKLSEKSKKNIIDKKYELIYHFKIRKILFDSLLKYCN